MSDTDLLWTLCALVVVNTIVVVLAYVSVVRESKTSLPRALWLYARRNGVTTRSIEIAAALGTLWSLIWFWAFGPLAIAPGIALTALVLLCSSKRVIGPLRLRMRMTASVRSTLR
jgi:hypothetical protein